MFTQNKDSVFSGMSLVAVLLTTYRDNTTLIFSDNYIITSNILLHYTLKLIIA